jgi:hypothetical protein
MAGRVPLENVSERKKTKWTHAVRTTATNLRNLQIVKNGPPGRNLGITLKINKWTPLKETACNKMKSKTYPYHVVLAPKTKHKKKGNESGINYPGELKTLNSSRVHKIPTRNGSVIGSDVTYRFLEYWIALRKVCSFRKTKQK